MRAENARRVPDLGVRAAEIGRGLDRQDLAALLALAQTCAGLPTGSLVLGTILRDDPWHARMHEAGVTDHFRTPGMPPGARKVRLSRLGWLALLSRVEDELQEAGVVAGSREHEERENNDNGR